MHTLEGTLADTVVGQRAARVTVGTEGHAGVVGSFHRHAAVRAGVRRFVGYTIDCSPNRSIKTTQMFIRLRRERAVSERLLTTGLIVSGRNLRTDRKSVV